MKRKLVSGHVEKAHEEKRFGEDGSEIMIGIVEGYLSTWDIDRANDRIERGAFLDTIAELVDRGRPLRLKRNHWNLIGGFDPALLKEDDKGLYGVAEINLMVQEGREAYMLAKQGVLSDFSIGFSAEPGDVDIIEGVRIFKVVKLWETSLVDEPMNPEAVAVNVRGFELPFAEMVDGEFVIHPDSVFTARAILEGARDGADIDDETRKALEEAVNDVYQRMDMLPPFDGEERGWSERELCGLSISDRRYILKHRKLSRSALEKISEALGSGTDTDDTDLEEIMKLLSDNRKARDDKVIQEITDLITGA